VTWREITNGLVNTQAIEREFNNHTKIAHIHLMVKKETNRTCVYITLRDVHKSRQRKQDDEDDGMQYFRSVSRYDINNAFLEKHVPLSNNVHGPYIMMPTKLLHTSGSRLIMYIF
jgi:hypothetical protein